MNKDTPFSQLVSSGCEPSFNNKKNGPDRSAKACKYLNSIAYDAILKAKPSVVILAIRRHHELNDWQKTVSRLYEIGVPKVIIIGPLPQWLPSLPLAYVKQHIGKDYITDPAFDKSLIKSNQFLIDLHAQDKNFIFINMLANLCFKSETIVPNCRVKVGDSLLAFDYGHLTIEASRFVPKKYITPVL
jgi:hypothetical protein